MKNPTKNRQLRDKVRLPALSTVALAVACAAGVNVSTAIPIDPGQASTLRNNQPVRLEDTSEGVLTGFYPLLSVSIGRQTNVLRTEGGGDSDTFVNVSPQLAYKNELGRHDLLLQYRANIYRYETFESENVVDHNLQGQLDLDITERLAGRLGYGFAQAHEQRGTLGARLFPGAEPDRFREHTVDGTLVYGRRSNTLQIAGTVGKSWLRYRNNDQGVRDRDAQLVGGSVFWNIGPNTSLFVKLQRTDIDYLHPEPGFDFDSRETTLHAGLRWEASAATVLQVEGGRTRKDFDDSAIEDFSGATYAGRVNWAPVEYSVFSLYAARSAEESTVLDSSHVVSDLWGLSWSHSFSDRWNVNLFVDKGKDKFTNGRVEDTTSYGGGLNYVVTDWLTAGLSYSRSERSSSLAGASYDDELLLLTLTTDFNMGGR